MRVFVATRQLVKEAVFPKELLVFSATLSNSVDYVIAMGVSLVVAWISGVTPTMAWLALPLVLVLQMLLVSWVSLFLSCVFPFARDVDHIYQVFLRALMFLSPIFYTESFVGEGAARYLVVLNPLAQLMQVSRAIVIDGVLPSWGTWLALLVIHGAFVWLGLKVFRAVEPRLAEYV
jgi:ABC-type polysaccharide/polyol phosphate export permease